MPSLPPPSPCPLSQPSCWSGEIIPPHLRSLIHKGTAPDHDAWLSRPAPLPISKRGISKISAPVIPLDLRTPAPVLTASVNPQHSLGIFRPAVLTHSNPAAVSRVTLTAQDLGPQCMSDKALGQHRCDHVTPPVPSTPTRTILDRSRVDIQQPLDSSDNHPGGAACQPPLHTQQTVQVHEQRSLSEVRAAQERAQLHLLETRAQSELRRLFDRPFAGGHDCFYVIAAHFQCVHGVPTTMLSMRQLLGRYSCPQKSGTG